MFITGYPPEDLILGDDLRINLMGLFINSPKLNPKVCVIGYLKEGESISGVRVLRNRSIVTEYKNKNC